MSFSRNQALRVATAAAVVAALTGNAYADELSFNFALSNGTQSGTANFIFNDDVTFAPTLDIVLTNTMTTNGENILAGLFFDITGSPILSNGSADGDMYLFDGTDHTLTDYTASEFWAFDGNLSAGELPFGDQGYGLGAAGFGVFSNDDIFEPGGPGAQPNGPNGGIAPDFPGVMVPGAQGNDPRSVFALGSVTFHFDLPSLFDIWDDLDVTDVAIVFGSNLDGVVTMVVPLPPALPMALVGLAGVVWARRRLPWLRTG